MNINEILQSNPGISLTAGNLLAGGYAINAVTFADATWTDEMKAAILDSIKSSMVADANLFDKASLKTFASEKDDAELYELKNVEIFRTGTWNNQKFSDADLQDIVAAFSKQGYRVPIKLGHRESSGDKAYGWVSSIRKVGDKLIADFADLPAKVYEAIKARSYDSVSSEIFSNLKRGNLLFKRALKAVALLGSEIPAVAGLKPLRHSFALPSGATFEHEYIFQLSNEDIKMDATELKAALDAANAKIAELTNAGGNAEEMTILKAQVKASNEALAAFAEKDRKNHIALIASRCRVPAYREFIQAIVDVASGGDIASEFSIGSAKLKIGDVAEKLIDKINADSELLFKAASRAGNAEILSGGTDTYSVSNELAGKIEAFIAANKGTDYAAAMNAVLHADPDLAARYNAAN